VRSIGDVPTIAESGYPGFEALNWYSIAVPTQTSEDIVRKLNAALRQVLSQPDIREYYENRGADPMMSTPEEMRIFLQKELVKWASAVRASGARVD
jgi:tripartite-type tricarboxylate transporter receptor subunit TctC